MEKKSLDHRNKVRNELPVPNNSERLYPTDNPKYDLKQKNIKTSDTMASSSTHPVSIKSWEILCGKTLAHAQMFQGSLVYQKNRD